MHDHHHSHTHTHDHAHHRAFSVSIFFNLLFVIVQVFYAYQANSMSLLADGWHNLSDVLGLCFAWAASFLHTRRPNERFSYGYKRTTIIASLVNALFLVATSAVIGYQSILKIMHPEPIQEWTVIIVAAIGILVNGGTALLFLKGRKDDLNIKGAWLHLLGDALISFGVVVTGLLVAFTGLQQLDGIACALIVVIIVLGTWGLLRESINLLLDAVPATANLEEIKGYLEAIPGVTQVHDVHIWALSTKETALTAHLVMPVTQLTDQDFVRIYKDLKENHQIDHSTLQIERGESDNPCPQAQTC